MATKKAARKKSTKNLSLLKPCRILRINSDNTITPPSMTLKHNECIRLRSPKGFSVDMKLVITLNAGGGGPITVHS
jgi:hypothetical protein